MKKFFINSSIDLVTKNKDYTKEQVEIITYGLEAIYLTVTKMVVIFAFAFLLGIFKEIILLLVFYNIIRSQAFGIHASRSIYCLIFSLIMFIGGALICKYCVFPEWLLIVLAIVCNICLFLFAPADTHKRPIINEKKRKKFKYTSLTLGIIYTVLIIIFKDYSIVNYLIVGLLEATVLILPITYKVFNMPYSNYKNFNCGV